MKQALAASIGKAARDARDRLGITQEDAAERIGVSVEFFSRIERGISLPSVITFARMAIVLGVSADKLIGRSEINGSTSLGWVPAPPEDPPELRSLFRRLRKATPLTLRLVRTIVSEMDKQSRGGGESDPDAPP
jgi:transcriptional regulator with XRE-family HTH domain